MVKPFVPGRHEVEAGVYALFEMAIRNAVAEGARGVVTMPIKADWGPLREFKELYTYTESKQVFGEGQTARLLELAFLPNPVAVKPYRIATEQAKEASLSLETIEVKALYTGLRGNSFRVTIRQNLANENMKELVLSEGAIELDTITFSDVAELVEKSADSQYIRVTKKEGVDGNVIPDDVNGQALTGGDSGAGVTVNEYAEFLKSAEGEQFNWIVPDGVKDEEIKEMFRQFVKDMRASGKLIRGSNGGTSDARTIDYYAITNAIQWAVRNGVKYEAEEVAIYIAAAAATCPLNRSLALNTTPFEEVQKLGPVELREKIREGNIVFKQEGRNVKFSTPVNTMTSIRNFDALIRMGEDADEDAVIRTLQKIRIIEGFDYIAEAEEQIFSSFADKSNTQARRLATAQRIKDELLEPLAIQEVIELGSFDCIPDPDYHGEEPIRNTYKDEAYFETSFVIVDSAEKIYNRNVVA